MTGGSSFPRGDRRVGICDIGGGVQGRAVVEGEPLEEGDVWTVDVRGDFSAMYRAGCCEMGSA